MPKLPFIQFFSGDWLADPQLSLCPPAVRGVWIDLLCHIHRLGRDGTLCASPEQLARLARCSPAEMVEALTVLQTTGTAVVTERNGVVTVLSRRMSRDAKQREEWRLRQNKKRGKPLVTPPSRDCPTVFHISEVIKSKSPPVIPPVGGNSAKPRRSPTTDLPADWQPKADQVEWAKQNCPDVDLEAETLKWRDYHAAKGSRFKDWSAAWRNWMRNAQEWKRTRPGERSEKSLHEQLWGVPEPISGQKG